MSYQFVFGTIKAQDRERRYVRVKAQEPPELPLDSFMSVETEASQFMTVTESFRAVALLKRDTDAEGNHYAWYAVEDYSCAIDRKPEMDAAFEGIREQISAIEDAACELDETTTDRLSAIEDALCDLDEMLNGGN